jgi:hypothetical protein
MVFVISPQKKKEEEEEEFFYRRKVAMKYATRLFFQKHKRENPGRSLGVRLIMYTNWIHTETKQQKVSK